MPTLHIQLLGEFRLTVDEAPITTLSQVRQQVLLAHLLLHQSAPQIRQQLAFLLWPDSSERQAQTNLRKALLYLRRIDPIFDAALYTDQKVVQWRSATPTTLDVAEFTQTLALAIAAEKAGQTVEAIALLTATVDWYKGPLLSHAYDDWIIAERERLHQSCISALNKLVLLQEEQHDIAAAISAAQHLLRIDPLHEPTYPQLMRFYAAQGDHAGALRTYHTCVTLLQRELGVDPGPETEAAYAWLLKRTTPTPSPASNENRRTHSTMDFHLVGRQAEWTQIQTAWRLATEQRAHLVYLTGEAGIGKTHLADALRHWVNQHGFATASARAYAGEGRLAYSPVVEWLRSDTLSEARKGMNAVWLGELARLLPEILIEQPTLSAPLPMQEAWQRRHLFEALAQAIVVAPQPLLLLMDDLQWCDSETLEWLQYLLHFAEHAQILIVGTVRIEEVDDAHPLQTLYQQLHRTEQLRQIALGPLDAKQTALLATHVAERTLDAAWLAQLYQTTEGNPLFIVESVRESDQRPAASGQDGTDIHHPLPPKVQAVIQHRLAQLSDGASEVATVAAVIGRSFTVPVLAQAASLTEDALVAGLDELWQRRLIREQDVNSYDFSHERIREVTYAAISPARRRLLHRQVGQALELIFGGQLASIAGQLSVHFEEAGVPQSALTYYRLAATTAHQLFAYVETEAFLRSSLRMLDLLPATAERIEERLDVLALLGSILIITKGFTASEVEEVFSDAREFCYRVDNLAQRFSVLRGLRLYWGQRCRWAISAELNADMLYVAQQMQSPVRLQSALRLIGAVAFHQGNLHEAFDYFKQAIALYQPEQHYDDANDTLDEGLSNLYRLSGILWFLGYPEQAQICTKEMLILARHIARPLDLLVALDFAFDIERYLRRPQAAQVLVKEITMLTAKYAYPQFVITDLLLRGWILAQQGELNDGIACLQQGIAATRNQGMLLFLPLKLAMLVEVYEQAKLFKPGLTLATEALNIVAETGDEFWSAELHRLKGELLLGQGSPVSAVEATFQEAIAIARRQGAKALELRATTSLARLWQVQSRAAEAHQCLAEIYNWFTEGFDTADLQDAKLLLDQLG